MRRQNDNMEEGTLGAMEFCDNRSFATGFQLKILGDQGDLYDDLAVTGIRIICDTGDNHSSIVHQRGSWKNEQMCESGKFLTGWSQRLEKGQSLDITGVNDVHYECRGFSDDLPQYLTDTPGLGWGSWSNYVSCPENEFICGIQTRVHENYGLTDITHQCCSRPPCPVKSNKMLKMKSRRQRKQKLKDKKKVGKGKSFTREGHI